MKIFLISPVRNIESSFATLVEVYVKSLESEGHKVHWPLRDTDQNDNSGLNICIQNSKAIFEADEVHIMWDGKSQGSLFDVGVAFAYGRRIIPILMPPLTAGKSFQNMIQERFLKGVGC